MAKNFIQNAIKKPGALTKSAHAAGESPMAFAKKEKNAKGKTGQRARFALFLNKVRPKKARTDVAAPARMN